MFSDLPNLLESFAAVLASQLFLVDFSLLAVVNVLDVCSHVVAVEEPFSANAAGIVPLT